jgi:hypothetical protein
LSQFLPQRLVLFSQPELMLDGCEASDADERNCTDHANLGFEYVPVSLKRCTSRSLQVIRPIFGVFILSQGERGHRTGTIAPSLLAFPSLVLRCVFPMRIVELGKQLYDLPITSQDA